MSKHLLQGNPEKSHVSLLLLHITTKDTPKSPNLDSLQTLSPISQKTTFYFTKSVQKLEKKRNLDVCVPSDDARRNATNQSFCEQASTTQNFQSKFGRQRPTLYTITTLLLGHTIAVSYSLMSNGALTRIASLKGTLLVPFCALFLSCLCWGCNNC